MNFRAFCSGLLLGASVLSPFVSIGQTITISTIPKSGSVVLSGGGDVLSNPMVYASTDIKKMVTASLNGCVTEGVLLKDLISEGTSEYVVKFKQVKPIPEGFKSRKIAFGKFVDIEGELSKSTTFEMGWTTSRAVTVNAEGKRYNDAVVEQLDKWGFNVIGAKSRLFEEETDKAEFTLAGEIVRFEKGTAKTPGFRVAVLIEWSLYDNLKRKVVEKYRTSGYSDSRLAHTIMDEYELALKDAMVGLMVNPEFQSAVEDKGALQESNAVELVETRLTAVKKQSFGSYSEMIKGVLPSVVTVVLEDGSHGSGFLISEDGFILTNNHVVEGSSKIQVSFSNGLQLPCEIVKTNIKRDVALIRAVGNGYKAIKLNTSEEAASLGTEVIAIGTPADKKLQQSVSKGIISGSREFEGQNYLQTDVTLNPGNSGGPILNADGEVIAIAVGKWNEKNTVGLGFGIPISEALKALNIVIE